MTASSTCCLGGEKRGLTLHSDTTVPSTLTSTLTVPVFYEQQVEESNLLTSGCCSGAGRVGVGRLDADKARDMIWQMFSDRLELAEVSVSRAEAYTMGAQGKDVCTAGVSFSMGFSFHSLFCIMLKRELKACFSKVKLQKHNNNLLHI